MTVKINKDIIALATLLILLTGCANKHQKYFNKIKEHKNLSSLFTDETIHRLADICVEDEEGENTLLAYQQASLKYQQLEQDVIQSMTNPHKTVGDVATKSMLLQLAYSTCDL